jgi:hypothetical protein
MRPLAAGESAEEDRHDAGLAVRILAWPIDVGQAQRDMGGPVEPVVRPEVLLAGELRRSVRRERASLRFFGRGTVVLAVDRASGGREDDLGTVATSRLEDLDRPEDVDLAVVGRAVD